VQAHHVDQGSGAAFPDPDQKAAWKFSENQAKQFLLLLLLLMVLFCFLGQRPPVPLLLLGPPFFPIILFGSTTLLTGMTNSSLHMQ
jgi:hypothetical protein